MLPQEHQNNSITEAIAVEVASRVAEILAKETKGPKIQPRYLTYETAGLFMDMPSETVRSLVKQKRLPASRDRGIVRIAVADIDAYMRQNRA